MGTAFQAASDRVAPVSVPQRRLDIGVTMPAVGMGTCGSDHVSASQVAEALKGAATGYRHFDWLSACGNEAAVGVSFAGIIAGGLRLQDMGVRLKLWNDSHAEADVIASVRANIYMDVETAFGAEDDAPGISAFPMQLGSLFEGLKCNQHFHKEIIAKLDQSAEAFRVLIIKTGLTIPYTSAFFEFDCGYWGAETEGTVRRPMACSKSKVNSLL